jgi:hypothetical protein
MTRALHTSERVYRALLQAYPSEFRRDYADEMALTFRAALRAAQRQSGTAGVLGQWGQTVPDFVVSVIDEHAQERFNMAKTNLTRLLALAGIVGGALWIAVAVLVALRPPGIPGGIYRDTEDLMPLFFSALGLAAAGLVAVYLQPGRDWLLVARGLILLGAAGGLWSALSPLVVDNFWVWIAGAFVQMLSLTLAGLTLLASRANRQWAILLLLMAGMLFLFNFEDWRAWFGVAEGAAVIAASALALGVTLGQRSDPPVQAG